MTDRELEAIVARADAAWMPTGEAPPQTEEQRGDASCPDAVRAQCPADRHPVSDGRGGWQFRRNDGRADAAEPTDRVERRDE
jgi:hypothetical protein